MIGCGNHRTICVAVGSKFPDLRTAAERAILQLRSVSKPNADALGSLDLSVLQTDVVLRPLILACQTKLPRLIVPALGTMQRLLQMIDPINQKFLSTVIGNLRIHCEVEDDSTCEQAVCCLCAYAVTDFPSLPLRRSPHTNSHSRSGENPSNSVARAITKIDSVG